MAAALDHLAEVTVSGVTRTRPIKRRTRWPDRSFLPW